MTATTEPVVAPGHRRLSRPHLTPPEPVAAVAPEKAGGMVPIDQAALPGLDAKVARVRRVDRRPRRALARVRRQGGRRALDGRRRHPRRGRHVEPVARRAGEGDAAAARAARSPTTLLDLRRTIERPRPGRGHGRQEAARPDPVRRQAHRLLPQVRERADAPRRDRQGALRRPGRAAQGQRRARAGEGAPLGDDAAARAVHLHRRAPRQGARREDRRDRGHRPREGQGAARRRAVLRAPEAPGPAHAAWRCRSRATSRSTWCGRTTSS